MAIEKNINEELVKKQLSAKNLIHLLFEIDRKNDIGNAVVYHQFPIYVDNMGEKPIKTDILFVSQKYGIFIFKCVENQERSGTFNSSEVVGYLEELDKLVFAKILKDAPSLSKRRNLKINISPCIFFYNYETKPDYEEKSDYPPIETENELLQLIQDNKKEELTEEEYKELKAAIDGSRGISKPVQRKIPEGKKDSKGEILNKIDNSIYNFDLEQKKAAMFILDGAQRIRGLAGSGKTVILAMKVAMIHIQNPEANILYTYYTKSLHDLIKRLITRFYRQFAEKDPNWDKISIMHAWGGIGLEGVYYNTCLNNNLFPINYSDAKWSAPSEPFNYICGILSGHNLKKQYDYSIIDEAQDFPENFYRVCRQITQNNRVIWAYDDFQNILNTKIKTERDLFGKDEKGKYHIDFSTRTNDILQDIVLYKCYRNPRFVLVIAFALGLGIYNEDPVTQKIKMVQRLENNEHWKSLGFKVEKGDSSVGSQMIISRPEENSADSKNKYISTPFKACPFRTMEEECKGVADSIKNDLSEGLNPEDITVITLDDRNAKFQFREIEKYLSNENIKTFSLLDAPMENKTYKVKNHVTLSTIYRAKGNEAGSVYVIGTDVVFANRNNITERNKLFTAITRSLAWITLTGVGSSFDFCIEEIKRLEANEFKLIFTQPSQEDVITIRQEISDRQRQLNEMEKIKKDLEKLGMSKEEIKAKLFDTAKL